jgi:hypothetical protein
MSQGAKELGDETGPNPHEDNRWRLRPGGWMIRNAGLRNSREGARQQGNACRPI